MLPRVALFIPCFVDQVCPQVGVDMARVLRRIGCEIWFPEDQTCCGQPAFNTGYWQDARQLAARFLKVFDKAEVVVGPSGSCVAMVRKFYPELLHSTFGLEKFFEFSEFLLKYNMEDVGASFPHKVTVHDSCHANRELGIRQGPRKLLKNVRGLELIEMRDSDECCGFGGTFSVKFGAISAAMGDVKTGNAEQTQADFVTAVDPSCLMHIDGILRKKRSPMKTIHLASILASEAAQ
ncbi:MAG TPA: (Fe-S)-binding protein [Terriglobales bacterium]|nr:(Fe-S)-binding protein [Terriglobales bacterium]